MPTAAATSGDASNFRALGTPADPFALSDRDGDRIFDGLETRLSKVPASSRVKVIVSLASPATEAHMSAIERVVGRLMVTHRFTVVDGFAASATPAQVEALSRFASVAHVEEDLLFHALNDSAQDSFGLTKARQDATSLDGDRDGNSETYSADDLVAAVIDTGIDATHDDLDEGKVLAFADCTGASCVVRTPFDDNGHGTHVAATLAGEGDARPDRRYHGVAPAAALVGVKVLDLNGQGPASKIAAGIDWAVANKAAYGIEAINLSVGVSGCANSAGTDFSSQAVNAAHAAGIVVSVAVGNSGPGTCTVGSPAGATGALTVGAMSDLVDDAAAFGSAGPGFYQAPFSSRGPTQDGRVKPDISAPGVGITSASAGTGNGYEVLSGTSMAAPFVAGVALLMLDADPALTPQLVKQTMMQTAIDWGRGGNNATPGTSGQDNDYGAGRLDAYAAIDAAGGPSPLGLPPAAPAHVLLQGSLAGSGAEAEYHLTVSSTQFPLAATLIAPGGGSRDFELDLYAPDGRLLASSETVQRQEQLGVTPPVPGTYALRVRSFSGGGGFFVDVSGATIAPASPSLRHHAAILDDVVLPGGDGDGVLEPGERFSLQERLKNWGSLSATGVSGALAALSPGLTLTQSAGTYGTIATGATGMQSTPFAGRLDPAVPCGLPARLSLALTTDQGAFTVLVEVPTGAAGPPTTPPDATTPVPIPDTGSVVSTLNVPTAGLVKDLDVRIGELRHTWVADLTIELTSPTGTRVLLVNRRGMGGQDFRGTVLDDEASTKILAESAPFTGRFRPEQPLSAFDGEQQQGAWTLKVTDHEAQDAGTLRSWGGDFRPAVCQVVQPTVSIDDISVVEGHGGTVDARFTVSLDQPSAGTVAVDYATAGGGAGQPSDYDAVPATTLTFAPGEAAKTVIVSVKGDVDDELDETYFVDLSGAIGASLGRARGVGTIVDDDGPSISIESATLPEGDVTGDASVVVSLSAPSVQPLSVDFATVDGSAVAPDDYTMGSGTLTIPAGSPSGVLAVPIKGDRLDEVDETFSVSLSNARGGTIGTGTATATIVDDDPLPAVTVEDVAVSEGASLDVPVKLDEPSGKTVTAQVTTADGTAKAGSDYTQTAATLTFAPGDLVETVPIPIRNDELDEPNETLLVNVAEATNAVAGDDQGVATIVDDDGPPTISIGDVTMNEGQDAVFEVELSAPSSQRVMVDFATADGTAAAPADYAEQADTLVFELGETTKTVSVKTTQDSIVEPNETFMVSLDEAVSAIIGPGTATGTILNDDAAPPPPPPPPSPSPPSPPPPPQPPNRVPKAGITTTRVVVTGAGVAPIEVSCSTGPCRGTVTLETSVGAGLASRDGQAKKLILGRRAYSLGAGRRKTIRVKLSRTALELLKRRGKLRAQAIVVVRRGTRKSRAVTLVAAAASRR